MYIKKYSYDITWLLVYEYENKIESCDCNNDEYVFNFCNDTDILPIAAILQSNHTLVWYNDRFTKEQVLSLIEPFLYEKIYFIYIMWRMFKDIAHI